MILFVSNLFRVLLLIATCTFLASCSEKQPADKVSTAEAATDAPVAATMNQEKIGQLEAQLRQVIVDQPDSAQGYAQLANFLLAQNKTADAIPAYQDAIMRDPENPKLFAALSIAYLHQSKFEMAKAMADEALRLKPDMEQVKKINEYIATKETVMEQAEKATSSMAKPDDPLHNLIKNK